MCKHDPVPPVARKDSQDFTLESLSKPARPAKPAEPDPVDEAQALRQKRDDARWYIIVGVALLFAGSINAYLAAGGAAMCLWGLGSYAYWGRRARSAYDPWKDGELDEWEDEHYG